MTFLRLATPYQILIFSILILHNILVSKSNSSAYDKFARHEQVLAWRVNLWYYEHWTDKQKYFYVILLILSYLSFFEFDAPSWKYANEFASISDT